MGTVRGSVGEDMADLALVGAARAAMAALPIVLVAWTGPFALLFGLALPAAYWIGYRVPLRLPLLRIGLEWGELLAGATWGLVLLVSISGVIR
jgi:hypothetical protein